MKTAKTPQIIFEAKVLKQMQGGGNYTYTLKQGSWNTEAVLVWHRGRV